MTPGTNEQGQPGNRLSLLIVATKDFGCLRDFYLRVFDPPVDVDVPVYCEMRVGSMRLGVYQAEAFTTNLGSSPQVEYTQSKSLNPVELYFYAHDIDEIASRITRLGGTLLAEAEPKPWGDTVAYFADPDGNILAIAQA